MKKNWLLHILLFIVSLFIFLLNPKYYFAATNSIIETKNPYTMINGHSVTGVSNGCKSWKYAGRDSCTIKFQAVAVDIACHDKPQSFSVTFSKNGKRTVTVKSKGCAAVAIVEVKSFDNDKPKVTSGSVSGTGCNKTSVSNGDTIKCAKTYDFVGHFTDATSGMVASKVSTTCKSDGSKCCVKGVDKVGHIKNFCVTGECPRCVADGISISSYDNKYNGYYVGKVNCSAKCRYDMDTGDNGTGSSTGSTSKCSVTVKDNCSKSYTRSIPTPRDTTSPSYCNVVSVNPQKESNGYYLGSVTTTWTAYDGQTGFAGGYGSGNKHKTIKTTSSNDNAVSSSHETATDRAGNTKGCNSSWKRDRGNPKACTVWYQDKSTSVAPSDRNTPGIVAEKTQHSNSSVLTYARCTQDNESGCSNDTESKYISQNGANSINVYDLTKHYSTKNVNSLACPFNMQLIDTAKPTCTATTTVSNPKLSSDGTKWSNMTWHNNQDYVYDVNGKVERTNTSKRVQAYLIDSSDRASSGGTASGVKSGFIKGTSLSRLSTEARTEYSEGSENGIYTVFVRDKVFNIVNNPLAGWSGSKLYAHGNNTSGNYDSCSANVYSFDNTKPAAHIKLSDKTVAGNYDVWDNNSKITMSAKTVNNNINSVTHWSSVDVYFKIWGTDPNGGKSYNGNEFQGRSGIKKVCYRLTQNSNHANTSWTCYEPNDQRDGSYGARSAEYSVPANTFTGITTIEVKVQDWAGNWSDVNNSQKVYIDTTRPTAKSDSTTSKNGFTEVVGTQNYNSMKNPIYPTQTGLDRPWVSQFVNSTFKGQDNTKNQYSGSYQFGYYWSTIEYNVQYADNQPYLVRADNSSRVNLSWNYFGTKTNANDKTAGIKVGTNTEFSLPTISNPAKTDYYWLYVRTCDNVEIGPRNCQIYKSKLVRFDNDQPSIDSILDVTNNESDTVAESAADGHGWTNKLKLKIKTSDKPVDNERSQVAYISYKWNTNYDSKDDDKNSATFDSKNTAYTDASTPTASLSESDWTYVKCSAQDSDANLCTTTIDFNKFVKGTSPVHEGYRFLKVAIVDKAGNVSGDNGIVYGPYKFDITPPEITGLEFRGHRADNNAEINYNK